MKILLLFLSCLPILAATNNTYTITAGPKNFPIFKETNCISFNLHTNDCYLIKYVKNGNTNEFHAWMTPIQVITNK